MAGNLGYPPFSVKSGIIAGGQIATLEDQAGKAAEQLAMIDEAIALVANHSFKSDPVDPKAVRLQFGFQNFAG